MHDPHISRATKRGVRSSLLLGTIAAALWLSAFISPSSGAVAAVPRLADEEPTTPTALAPPVVHGAAAEAPRASVARRPAPPVARSAVATPTPPEPSNLERPDTLTDEEQQTRAAERATLVERFDRQEPNPEAVSVLQNALAERLASRNLPSDALGPLDCRRTLCRFELATLGKSGLTPLAEVHELIRTVRDLGETWLLATELSPGRWSVEAFAPTAEHNLTGPAVE